MWPRVWEGAGGNTGGSGDSGKTSTVVPSAVSGKGAWREWVYGRGSGLVCGELQERWDRMQRSAAP